MTIVALIRKRETEKTAELRMQKSAIVMGLLEADASTGDIEAIRQWLTFIGEHDPRVIAEVLDNCRTDADARRYFTRRACAEPSQSSGNAYPLT